MYRTPDGLDFPDMASLPSAHPAGRSMLYLDWRR